VLCCCASSHQPQPEQARLEAEAQQRTCRCFSSSRSFSVVERLNSPSSSARCSGGVCYVEVT